MYHIVTDFYHHSRDAEERRVWKRTKRMETLFRCLWFPPQDGFFLKVLMKFNIARSEASEIWKPYEKEEGAVKGRIRWWRFGVEKAFNPSMRCNLHEVSISCSEYYINSAYNRLWKKDHIKISLQDNNLIVYLSRMFSSCSYMKIKFSLPEIVYAVQCKMYRIIIRYRILIIIARQQPFAAIARKTKQLLLNIEY